MSEIVRNGVSTESLCTVIENIKDTTSTNSKPHLRPKTVSEISNNPTNENSINLYNSPEGRESPRYSYSESEKSVCDTCDTSQDESNASRSERNTSSGKLKKSVTFDPQDEKVRKFIAGEPIVDQQNPFIQHYSTWENSSKNKKVPPPVPTKRSTLSVRKTVTQQLREREREKEKERERLKNETNNRKSNISLSSPEDFVTTEEVLNQSKYVKTYIKNPDPYFVYDPTILARLKFEELRELVDKKQPKKVRLTNQTRDRIKDLKSKPSAETSLSYSKLPFKKCSKPNYPELCDIKIKVGTDLEGNFLNPAEVSKNVKKFDDRVKKLHISSDDDLDEIDCPLTKSESSDEVTPNTGTSKEKTSEDKEKDKELENMNVKEKIDKPIGGTFTNTIKSKEFQEYLEKKGLTLIPRKIPNGARSVYTNGLDATKPTTRISFRTPESLQISVNNTESAQNSKKPSVFQRLLSNSIFATRRKTTPKDAVPSPKSLYNYNMENKDDAHRSMKRVVLERQSFHGRPHTKNLLSPAESDHVKHQDQRSRKSFANGDNLSISLSSVLTNAELNNSPERNTPAAVIKPPRRTHSRERLANTLQTKQLQQNNVVLQPKAQRIQQVPNNIAHMPQKEVNNSSDGTFKRSTERQSLIPKRTTQTFDRKQVFGRSTSMDRNEILKKRLLRELQNRSKSDNEASNITTPFVTSRENIEEQLSTWSKGPTLTSTPIRDADRDLEKRGIIKPMDPPKKVYVDKQEWERLKAMKERMDNELYYRMLQEQKHQKDAAENIYERVQPQQIFLAQSNQLAVSQPKILEGNFIRGSPQRNTFAGLTRNRQTKIIDGKALIPQEYHTNCEPAQPRSQSVLDNMTLTSRYVNRSQNGYGSDIGTPVVLRRKDNNQSKQTDPTEQRRIGGILTRDEILQKVKEFCRKSLNKTPTKQQPQIQAIHKKLVGPSDLSPVSYASVETTQRPGSRMYAAPQVPQRMQSLPQKFIPINNQQMIHEINPNTSLPIYAHVVKRSSLLSNHSETYDSPQRLTNLVRADVEPPALYVTRGSLPPPQYVLVEGDKLLPATEVISYYPVPNDTYAQPHYVRPYKLQPVPGAYGYISVREPLIKQQFRPRLLDGRSTPLILDHSSQQTSQIYWTSHNPRWQQDTELLPIETNSPRYTVKQIQHPVAAPKMDITNHNNIKPTTTAIVQNNQPTTIEHGSRPNSRQHQTINPARELVKPNSQHPYEWESGSEAGEVQRILEHPRNSD
ncbi:uncharacterized protein [Eurosta solidaginis]|uniref:uncharacterized protein n=1 Tax=Eurosta solidaginis TaxID=178769 RepID=UPI003530F2BF